MDKELAFVQQLWSRAPFSCPCWGSEPFTPGGCRGIQGMEGTAGIKPEHLDTGIPPKCPNILSKNQSFNEYSSFLWKWAEWLL